MQNRNDIADLKAALAVHFEAVVESCFPEQTPKQLRKGRDARGPYIAYGLKAGSFIARPTGFIDFANPDLRGSLIDAFKISQNCSFPEAVKAAREFLNLPELDKTKATKFRQGFAQTAQKPFQKKKWDADLSKIWNAARPLKGSIAQAYLESRGCWFEDLNDVRFHPQIWHSKGLVLPAMVARITDPLNATPLSLHYTFLKADGSGKAEISPSRKMAYGYSAKGIIRLTPQEEVHSGLHLAEGIETTLTAMCAGYCPAWATVNSGNLADFPVIPGIESLSIFVDNDPKFAGERAAEKCADRWLSAKPDTEMNFILAPAVGSDWNDFSSKEAA